MGIYQDFTKAFDLVNHDILLYKLKMYGISRTTLKGFGSFLKGRRLVVKTKSTLSDMLGVDCGVPQGGGGCLDQIYLSYTLRIHIYPANTTTL